MANIFPAVTRWLRSDNLKAALLTKIQKPPRRPKWACALTMALILPLATVGKAGQKELQKLTVGFTPISGAAIPLFIAIEEKIFQKYGYEASGIFMGGSPLINS